MALLVDVLNQTQQAAVAEATELAVKAVAGPEVLTTPEVLARLEQYQAATQAVIAKQAGIINQQSTVIQQLSSTLAGLQNALPGQITDALSAYNTSIVAPLVQQAGATATSLSALQTTVSANAATTTAVLATKAAAGDLSALATTVAGKAAAADLSALATVVNGKASASDLSGLATTVAGKALASDLATTNSNVAANTAAINLRATTATVTTLQAAVTQNTTDLGTKATTAALATQTGRIDGLINTTVPALQADTATRLLRAGDVATGSIMVPNATVAAAAPRLDQTYGGLNAPIRFATSVGATAVAMLPGPLTDPTPQGRKAKPYLVVLTMRSTPTVGATITVGTTAGGAEVFTKTYTLALLPGLNAVLAPMQPIFIELPAGTTLYAKATAGTWDVEVLSYYKS